MKFEAIELDNSKWDEMIQKCEMYDFHHTSCFHKIEVLSNEKAVLLCISDNLNLVCLPLIIRAIEGAENYDATSVYGYCGPISSKPIKSLPTDFISFFQESFLDYCCSQKIVSVFSRLHPLLSQNTLFGDLGTILDLNKTVAIDLSESPEVQRAAYSRSYKNQINKLRKKKGYTVKTISVSELSVFKDIYFETMDRVDAKDYYYFSDEYLKNLMKNKCFETRTLVAYNNQGIPVSACIFTISKGIMQYHLGGTKDEALNDAPIKLIMDEARLIGNELKLKYMHLGGGVGGSDDDSLFKFKLGFSKELHQFSIWKIIVDREVYDKLVKEKSLEHSQTNFFPLYRFAKT